MNFNFLGDGYAYKERRFNWNIPEHYNPPNLFEHKITERDFKYSPKIHVKSIKKERYLRKLKQRKRQGKIKK